MISYCIACYRPRYATMLIDELVLKTTAPYEILVWLNVADAAFESRLRNLAASGVPLRIVGSTPHNIGMSAYRALFAESRYPMTVQIDDDVVRISPGIAETADAIFRKYPQIGMLTADVWQDEYTTGARPEMCHYRVFNAPDGLFDGPIDGWFAVYRRSSLNFLDRLPTAGYYPLGGHIKQQLRRSRIAGLLCTQMKVFHVIGPQYASYFGMLDSEIEKYRALGRHEIVRWYENARPQIPPATELDSRVAAITAALGAG